MAMNVGGTDELSAEPNVVPMIDILLVLLIIFMIMIPMSRMALDLQLPDPQPQTVTEQTQTNQIVLEILPNDQYLINKEPVPRDRLGARLREIYDPRPEKIIFIKGDGSVTYQNVVWAMDVARGSGVKVIGIPPSGSGDN